MTPGETVYATNNGGRLWKATVTRVTKRNVFVTIDGATAENRSYVASDLRRSGSDPYSGSRLMRQTAELDERFRQQQQRDSARALERESSKPPFER